jgi:hypothetical protein
MFGHAEEKRKEKSATFRCKILNLRDNLEHLTAQEIIILKLILNQ